MSHFVYVNWFDSYLVHQHTLCIYSAKYNCLESGEEKGRIASMTIEFRVTILGS